MRDRLGVLGRAGLALQENRLPEAPWGLILRGGLRAASWLYGAGHRSRMAAYRTGCFRTRRLPCRVISVGNLTVGGTGKTPAVLAIAQSLLCRNRRVAILSRGYAGASENPVTVVSDGRRLLLHPPLAADEAYLLAKRLIGVPVLTGPDRHALGLHALEKFGVEGVILDDGFQHVQLARDLNLLLLDASEPFGNGFLIPRGTLREPGGAVRRADGVLITRAASPDPEIAGILRRRFPDLPVVVSRFVPAAVRTLPDAEPVLPSGRRVFLACGIARPDTFRALAAQAGLEEAGCLAFSDHHAFGRREVEAIQDEARAAGAEAVLVTEKDAVKLPSVEGGDVPWWSLTMRMEILGGEPSWRAWTSWP